MKLIAKIILLLVVSIGFTSCNWESKKKETRLKNLIEEADKGCPVNMGVVGDAIRIGYNSDTKEVEYYISLNENIISIDVLKKNADLSLKTMKATFSKLETRGLLKDVVNAGAGLSVIYKGSSSGKSHKLTLPFEELQDIYDNPMTDRDINLLKLKNNLAIQNSMCPHIIDEGIEITKVYDNTENVVYNYRINEQICDISVMKYNHDAIKREMRSYIKNQATNDVKLFKDLGRGVIFHYYGDTSGDSIDIEFPFEELKKLL